MRLSTTLQLSLGLLLSGCTFNHQTHVSKTIEVYSPNTSIATTSVETETHTAQPPITPSSKAEEHQKCEHYKPARIASPVQVDLEKIKQARNEKEISEILLQNIGALNSQIKDFAALQERQYQSWLKKCHRA